MKREEIEKNYKSIISAIDNSDLISASLNIRHILEIILQEYVKKYSPENIYDDIFSKINSLEEKGIFDKKTANIYHNLRQLGNRGAHYTENGNLSEEDVERALAPLRQIINEFYFKITNDVVEIYEQSNYNMFDTNKRTLKTDKISNLYGLADNAYNNRLYAEAEQYYKKILSYDEMEFEAAYNLSLCKAFQSEDLASVAIKLSECLPNVFYRISTKIDDEKTLIDYYRYISEQIIDLEEEVEEKAWCQYKKRTMTGNELLVTRIRTSYALYKIGEQIDTTEKPLKDIVVRAWKKGIEIHNNALEVAPNKSEHRKNISIIEKRIKMYEPTYSKPRYKGNDFLIIVGSVGIVIFIIVMIIVMII